MEDERHPEQTPSLDPQSVEIARLKQEHRTEIAGLKQEHRTEIAQWQSKTAQLKDELAQLKKTSHTGGRNQDEATLTQGSPQQKLPPQKQRRGSVVENLAGE